MAKTTTIHGKQYPSIAAAARATGYSRYHLIRWRKQKEQSAPTNEEIEEAVNKAWTGSMKAGIVNHEGEDLVASLRKYNSSLHKQNAVLDTENRRLASINENLQQTLINRDAHIKRLLSDNRRLRNAIENLPTKEPRDESEEAGKAAMAECDRLRAELRTVHSTYAMALGALKLR